MWRGGCIEHSHNSSEKDLDVSVEDYTSYNPKEITVTVG